MFTNLRYLCLGVFTALVILTLFITSYFKDNLIESVAKNIVKQQADIIINEYTQSIWNRFYPVIAYLYTQPVSEWEVYPQYQAFKEESKSFFNNIKIPKLIIYNNSDYVIFDAESSVEVVDNSNFVSTLLKNDKHANNLVLAKAGQTTYSVVNNVKIKGQTDTKVMFNVLMPLKVTAENQELNLDITKAQGVIEFNFDITDIYVKVDRIKFIISLLTISGLAILTLVVIIGSRKAETVIEKQQEDSMEMASAKMMAESENKAKSQFLANVSHELRTPLNAIIGFSEIISSESMGPLNNEKYKEFIHDIHTSGVHLLSLINDILDFSKAEENKLQVDFEQIELTKLVKVCMRMVLPRAEAAQVKLTEAIPNEPVIIMADQKRFKQVVLNLLSNAVKFTQEAGEVTLRVIKNVENSSVSVEVKDTGVGMAAQDLARALAPFGQVDNKLSRRYEGTGLGLPLTKKLVELMKGRFDIKSEPGLGTTVTLTFLLPSNEIEIETKASQAPTPAVPATADTSASELKATQPPVGS